MTLSEAYLRDLLGEPKDSCLEQGYVHWGLSIARDPWLDIPSINEDSKWDFFRFTISDLFSPRFKTDDEMVAWLRSNVDEIIQYKSNEDEKEKQESITST